MAEHKLGHCRCFNVILLTVVLPISILWTFILKKITMVPIASHMLFFKYLKGHSSGQSHFSEINVKLAEKNKYATHSVQRSLEMCENKEKPSVSEDFRQKKFYQ